MSDLEERCNTLAYSDTEENCDVNLEGACGGDISLRGSTLSFEQLSEHTADDTDNLSMEVNLGESGSRQASEISSLSYQNLIDDDGLESMGLQHDSDESGESCINDYPDVEIDFPTDDMDHSADILADSLTEKLCKCSGKDLGSHQNLAPDILGQNSIHSKSGSDTLSDGSESVGGSHHYNKHSSRQKELRSDILDGKDVKLLDRNGILNTAADIGLEKPWEVAVNLREKSKDSKYCSPDETVKKRNSLEIRNNIPTIGEVKNYDERNIPSSTKYNSQGAKPKIKRQSPGFARRVNHSNSSGSCSDRDGSSSERETLPYNNQDLKQISPVEQTLQSDLDVTMHNEVSKPDRNSARKNVNIENEYDYVKYARIHQGNSYVGMRLAFPSSSISSSSPESSRDCSPEKIIHQKNGPEISDRSQHQVRVSEDCLTEIPLNNTEPLVVEEKRAFTLSPENTECDSAEVESVLSDEEKSNTGGMPIVEDGLSGSQASDVDEAFPHECDSPAKMLQLKQKSELNQEINGEETHINGKGKSIDTSGIKDELDAKEALNHTMADIKTAIQKSKNVSLKSSFTENSTTEEPVWIKSVQSDEDIEQGKDGKNSNKIRDNYEKLHRNEEMRRVLEEIERRQEEEFTRREQEKEDADDSEPLPVSTSADGEAEGNNSSPKSESKVTSPPQSEAKVYEMENEKDGLLENQYTRNDGKTYQTPKGYETDDEYEDNEDMCYVRRNKGRKYASVPNDEGIEKSVYRTVSKKVSSDLSSLSKDKDQFYNDVSHASAHGAPNSSACQRTSVPTKYYSGSQGSSEESGSDEVVSPSNSTTAYVKTATPGVNSISSTDYDDEDGDSPVQFRCPATNFDTDEETDKLLQKQYQTDQHVDIPELSKPPINLGAQPVKKNMAEKRRSRAKEVCINDPDNPAVLIEGVLFRARYLGSTQLISEGQPSKPMRMIQAQEAVGRIKGGDKELSSVPAESYEAPEGENQPSTEVDLFVSTEKIMVLNTDLQEIMMDHSLRTISYIADIGDILVIMARRRLLSSPGDESLRRKKQAKILCHVFESDEAQLIAQSIGQAFQVAYMEFLKANGIDDPGIIKEMDYQDVLNQQEIMGEELNLFTNKDFHREVIVPKLKGEPIGIVIVESGWGSMVPTVVLANMAPSGPAARCGGLNIGDQIISINGISMVGLPLSTCQTYIKGARQQTVVKLTVVPCPPVVEVLIKRPDVKYQLGFSVQNGVICSLLRGGIAERGGVRVGHRIIEINNQSVVAVQHEKIVALLANSVGEIHMKTMPTSIFRLLTGQETPHYL
ncbi:amyloid-beta A4 precursor protein-binding family A member 1 isoform X6 [Octopus sinensis]|uniref:Amyloid-beta A4 precursor protein-binding family A member 1 isoform X6 n=1 Tax=Octopus sinensis TaxID=2607531 RepID=A0A7E6EY42_9MOLL|nr:amyloid-beta A4 precursor protein-binding family A member 1 isoform X6 [Octopus sinensis]